MKPTPAFPTTTLAEVQSRFAYWRKNKQHRDRIPEELWAAAVVLSQEYSICTISKELSLSYTDLKERAQQSKKPSQSCRTSNALDFIPIDITPTFPAECTVEMEHRNGNKVRMHFTGKADLDLHSFAESFWRTSV